MSDGRCNKVLNIFRADCHFDVGKLSSFLSFIPCDVEEGVRVESQSRGQDYFTV